MLDFDHHCKWLNNCIGRLNYRLFMLYIGTVTASALIISAVCVAVWLVYFTDANQLRRDFGRNTFCIFGRLAVSEPVWLTLLSSVSIIAITSAALTLHLLVFHIRLSRSLLCARFHHLPVLTHQTTYGYVMSQKVAASSNPGQPPPPPATTSITESQTAVNHQVHQFVHSINARHT